jgi:hypothetical protein
MCRLLARIRKDGPLQLRDVKSTGSVQSWSAGVMGKIERRALHELWIRGDIMIRSRKGFQKVFDLPQRVLPAGTNTTPPSHAEAAVHRVRGVLKALGIARLNELHYLQDAETAASLRKALASLIRGRQVVEARITELPNLPVFALPESLELAGQLTKRRVRFLSPFDNLIIQRKRLKWLFNFDYTVEMYLPPAKRKYGYFVLPILWGQDFIGRMDAKAERAERRLLVRNLVFEPGFASFDELKPPFVKALKDFARFQKCEHFQFSRIEPSTFRLAIS